MRPKRIAKRPVKSDARLGVQTDAAAWKSVSRRLSAASAARCGASVASSAEPSLSGRSP